MKLTLKKMGAALGFTLMLGSAPAFASGDSSADTGSFASVVEGSTGVIVRVPINEKGEELTNAAEMRLHNGSDLSTSGDFQTAFTHGVDAAAAPAVSSTDVSRDSSTSGWYGGYCGNNGWQQNYYRNYQPVYYNYGNYYRYNYSCYQNYYNVGNYYGYRYYYYRHNW